MNTKRVVSNELQELIEEGKQLQRAVARQFLRVKITMYVPAQNYQMKELAEEAVHKGIISENIKNGLKISVRLIPNDAYNKLINTMRSCYQRIAEVTLPDPEFMSRGIQIEFSRLIPKNAHAALDLIEKEKQYFQAVFEELMASKKEKLKEMAIKMFDTSDEENDEKLKQFIIEKCLRKIDEFCKKGGNLLSFKLSSIKVDDEIDLNANSSITEQLINGLFEIENNINAQLLQILTELKKLARRELREVTALNKLREIEQLRELIKCIQSNTKESSLIHQRLAGIEEASGKIIESLKKIKCRKGNEDEVDRWLIRNEQIKLKQYIQGAIKLIEEEYGYTGEEEEIQAEEEQPVNGEHLLITILEAFQEWLQSKRLRQERGVYLSRAIATLVGSEPELLKKIETEMEILNYENYLGRGKNRNIRQEAIKQIEEMKQRISNKSAVVRKRGTRPAT